MMPSAAWKAANPERQRAMEAGYRERHREQRNVRNRRYYERNKDVIAARRRGVDATAITPRPGTCPICGSGQKICLDHCHDKQEFRGWLCNNCNVALGFAQDSAEILRKLADYVDAHDSR